MDKRCTSCGSLTKEDARYCNTCGANLANESGSEQRGGVAEISSGDAKEIIGEIQRLYGSIPLLARPMVPPMPEILRRIPASAHKYTLQQLIDLLEEAHAQRLL